MILPFLIGVALGASRAETPESYMERLYGNYHDPSFNPLTHPQLYFTPRLVTALKEDSRLAHGEAGYLDGDPVCQCQDTAGLHDGRSPKAKCVSRALPVRQARRRHNSALRR